MDNVQKKKSQINLEKQAKQISEFFVCVSYIETRIVDNFLYRCTHFSFFSPIAMTCIYPILFESLMCTSSFNFVHNNTYRNTIKNKSLIIQRHKYNIMALLIVFLYKKKQELYKR